MPKQKENMLICYELIKKMYFTIIFSSVHVNITIVGVKKNTELNSNFISFTLRVIVFIVIGLCLKNQESKKIYKSTVG